MSAHALCRCGEAGGTAHCPVHGQENLTPQQQKLSVSLSQQPVPTVRCAMCGQALSARWDTGMTVDDTYLAVSVHRCPTQDVRIVDASALSDAELLAELGARGL